MPSKPPFANPFRANKQKRVPQPTFLHRGFQLIDDARVPDQRNLDRDRLRRRPDLALC
jgi:hypothetical protein